MLDQDAILIVYNTTSAPFLEHQHNRVYTHVRRKTKTSQTIIATSIYIYELHQLKCIIVPVPSQLLQFRHRTYHICGGSILLIIYVINRVSSYAVYRICGRIKTHYNLLYLTIYCDSCAGIYIRFTLRTSVTKFRKFRVSQLNQRRFF